MNVRYTPKKGFSGTETVELEIIWTNGDRWRRDYVVTVN